MEIQLGFYGLLQSAAKQQAGPTKSKILNIRCQNRIKQNSLLCQLLFEGCFAEVIVIAKPCIFKKIPGNFSLKLFII